MPITRNALGEAACLCACAAAVLHPHARNGGCRRFCEELWGEFQQHANVGHGGGHGGQQLYCGIFQRKHFGAGQRDLDQDRHSGCVRGQARCKRDGSVGEELWRQWRERIWHLDCGRRLEQRLSGRIFQWRRPHDTGADQDRHSGRLRLQARLERRHHLVQ